MNFEFIYIEQINFNRKTMNKETNKEFPLEDVILFQEMVALLAPVYFPESLKDDAIDELASAEVERVSKLICRKYHFDDDKYILENGNSPFDFVEEDIKEEVYSRICKDRQYSRLINIREKYTQMILDAVIKERNVIGTFYQNRGVHYRDEESPEYENSPIVVIHNSSFTGYGGYEAATVYEVFINTDGKLLCTLNGEGGEDFDEPIENIQVEGLVVIVHWMVEQGFIPLALL